MSKMSKVVKEEHSEKVYQEDLRSKKAVENYMGGISYEVNPLLTLKMITSSSIFGEPQYYRDGEFYESGVKKDLEYSIDPLFAKYLVILGAADSKNKKTSTIMEEAIDMSLDYDFKGTLEWAVELRKNFNMRLNPQVIMVRAASHPKRHAFTTDYPGLFAKIQKQVMSRADEPASQMTYYLYKNKGIHNLPNLLKKTWADKVASLSRYEFAKYKNKGLGLIDVVRISHAKGELVDELMRTGTVVAAEEEKTWESLKAQGKTWDEIIQSVKLPHMALLRNLRGIFTDRKDEQLAISLMESLKAGVKNGKQFPFAYKTAYQVIASNREVVPSVSRVILPALNECVDVAADQMPHLTGKTVCLSDNSGSANGTFTSEFGRVSISNIGNLSSVITAKNSDDGYVGVFGDRLVMLKVDKDMPTIETAARADAVGESVGGGTENGIWLFFDKAIRDCEHWDNIFIYSDQQAGHGGLYGIKPSEYKEFQHKGRYVDVAKLIDVYRKKVNPLVNVFCIQTAGYENVLVPEYGYRTNILYGWTGKELVFADQMIKLWDEYDTQASE